MGIHAFSSVDDIRLSYPPLLLVVYSARRWGKDYPLATDVMDEFMLEKQVILSE